MYVTLNFGTEKVYLISFGPTVFNFSIDDYLYVVLLGRGSKSPLSCQHLFSDISHKNIKKTYTM